MKTIRAFIALDLPSPIKAALRQASQTLAQQLPPHSVRWVKPSSIHLTLHFLGETAVAILPQLSQALDQVASQHDPFTLTLGQLGFFPNPKRPRVIWVGFQKPQTTLQTLKEAIDTTIAPLGWQPDERPFHPHLTIGRVKDSRPLRSVKWQLTIPPLKLSIMAVYLIQSQLRPNGPIYTVRHQSNLTATKQTNLPYP